MKFIRFKKDGTEKTGALYKSNVYELSCGINETFAKSDFTEILKEECVHNLSNLKILPPLKPSKIVCIGLNYRDHARELNMDIPDEPVIFIKPSTAVIGHLDPIIYPPFSKQVDYEVELAVVISRIAQNVDEDYANNYINGYTILNDVTARDLQRKDGQWTRAKSFNTFCPIGPCIETELNPIKLNISLKLNGEIKQDSNTKNMIFNPEELVDFISHIMTLNPGDLIATGTPPGVGPMKVGDTLEAEVEGIGSLKNFVIKKEL